MPPAKPVLPTQPRREDAAGDDAKTATASDTLAFVLPTTDDHPDQPPPPPEQQRKTEFTVIRQETVLPPAGHPAAAQQAAEKIIADLKDSAGTSGPDAATSHRETPSTPAPTRVLHIQLQPPELGTLTVKLSLRDNALDIRLEAAEHHTLRLLEADRDRLSDMLRSAGYAVDGLAVQMPAGDRSASGFTSFNGGNAACLCRRRCPAGRRTSRCPAWPATGQGRRRGYPVREWRRGR